MHLTIRTDDNINLFSIVLEFTTQIIFHFVGYLRWSRNIDSQIQNSSLHQLCYCLSKCVRLIPNCSLKISNRNQEAWHLQNETKDSEMARRSCCTSLVRRREHTCVWFASRQLFYFVHSDKTFSMST